MTIAWSKIEVIILYSILKLNGFGQAGVTVDLVPLKRGPSGPYSLRPNPLADLIRFCGFGPPHIHTRNGVKRSQLERYLARENSHSFD